MADENKIIGDDKSQAQAAQEAKAEQGELTREMQDFETDRAIREQRSEGGTNRPSIEGDESRETAAARLRAFEDEHFGKEAVRINGQIEKGSGSPYSMMNPERKKQYLALERVQLAEQKLADAEAVVAQAAADRDAAEAHLDACEKATRPDADHRDE